MTIFLKYNNLIKLYILNIVKQIFEQLLTFFFLFIIKLENSYYINPNKMHMLQSLFYLTTTLHVSNFTITHLQEHKQL